MALARQIEELVLLKCSLLPDEILEFVLDQEDFQAWTQVVNAHSEAGGDPSPFHVSCPAHFSVKIRDVPVWFKVDFPDDYPLGTTEFNVVVRGYNISRMEQQRWQDVISNRRAQIREAAFPAYELISLHLLPLLHDEFERSKLSEGAAAAAAASISTTCNPSPQSEPEFHALLTSHHLKSPHKRRLLQQWSSESHLHGFAKVGHPGLIYCSGLESDVREFVSRVKEMQWLALRVRFAQVLPDTITTLSRTRRQRGSWMEVEKVGEVVDEMRKLGRESYVLNLGIGSGGAK